MPVLYLLSAFSAALGKADIYLLPCPFKMLTGYDCPGCGFQRSLLALLKGNLQQSLQLYPALMPILLTLVVGLAANYWWKEQRKRLINTLFTITAAVVLISYVAKIMGAPIF